MWLWSARLKCCELWWAVFLRRGAGKYRNGSLRSEHLLVGGNQRMSIIEVESAVFRTTIGWCVVGEDRHHRNKTDVFVEAHLRQLGPAICIVHRLADGDQTVIRPFIYRRKLNIRWHNECIIFVFVAQIFINDKIVLI